MWTWQTCIYLVSVYDCNLKVIAIFNFLLLILLWKNNINLILQRITLNKLIFQLFISLQFARISPAWPVKTRAWPIFTIMDSSAVRHHLVWIYASLGKLLQLFGTQWLETWVLTSSRIEIIKPVTGECTTRGTNGLSSCLLQDILNRLEPQTS